LKNDAIINNMEQLTEKLDKNNNESKRKKSLLLNEEKNHTKK
jgi:hypothetical protein